MKIRCGTTVWSVLAAATAALILTAPVLRAADSEPVSVTVGKMEVVTTPFPVEGFRVADKSVAAVESLGKQQLRIMGLKAGTTDLQVTGQSGLSALYTITVIENIRAVYAALTRDLDTVPEVELTINMGRVLIKGEVSSIDHWNYLSKVVAMYGPEVVNLSSFHPAPEVMLQLKKALEKGGFTVQEAGDESAPAPGILSVKFTGNNIFVRGQVYGQRDLDKIRQIIGAQTWLALADAEEKKEEESLKVKAILDVMIVPTLIELDSAFVGVTDVQEKEVGVNLAKAGLLLIDTTAVALRGTVGDSRPEGGSSSSLEGSYVVSSGLEGALKFFGGSGPGRFHTAGHMTFKNDSPEWRSYHSGGTLKVRVAGRDAANLEDIDYGLIMRCKGGLIDPKTAELDVELELSYPTPVGFDYDLKRNKIATTVTCPLGHTLVMGGMKSLVEQSSNEGVPFLRSVPVVSWFFSEKNERLENSKVLVMLSPQIAGAPKLAPPVSEQTISTAEEAEIPNKERERKKRGRRFFFF